mgnify:CR=1 FL=1
MTSQMFWAIVLISSTVSWPLLLALYSSHATLRHRVEILIVRVDALEQRVDSLEEGLAKLREDLGAP